MGIIFFEFLKFIGSMSEYIRNTFLTVSVAIKKVMYQDSFDAATAALQFCWLSDISSMCREICILPSQVETHHILLQILTATPRRIVGVLRLTLVQGLCGVFRRKRQNLLQNIKIILTKFKK